MEYLEAAHHSVLRFSYLSLGALHQEGSTEYVPSTRNAIS